MNNDSSQFLAVVDGMALTELLGIEDASPMLIGVFDVTARVLQSLFVVAIALIISFILRRAIYKFFRLQGRCSAKSETLSSVLINFVKYGIGFLAVSQILTYFGVRIESILAVAGIGGVAIGFGAQTIVRDVLSGIFILLENQYNVGEVVQIGGLAGIIESVGIRTTKIREANGRLHILPNSSISIVTNLSRDYQRPTINLEFPASHPVDNILDMLTDEMSKAVSLPGLTSPPKVQGLIDLSPSSFTIQIQAECETNYCWPIERELRRLIKLRFEKENVS